MTHVERIADVIVTDAPVVDAIAAPVIRAANDPRERRRQARQAAQPVAVDAPLVTEPVMADTPVILAAPDVTDAVVMVEPPAVDSAAPEPTPTAADTVAPSDSISAPVAASTERVTLAFDPERFLPIDGITAEELNAPEDEHEEGDINGNVDAGNDAEAETRRPRRPRTGGRPPKKRNPT
jgi:ribonuclease E